MSCCILALDQRTGKYRTIVTAFHAERHRRQIRCFRYVPFMRDRYVF